MEISKTTITHKNGGIEQAILEIVDEDGLLSDKDKQRLEYLKTLPQNRVIERHYKCPVCGYFAYNGYECFDCGYTK